MNFNPFTAKFDFNGKNLIEASAGTGKTYSIAAIYLRLLIEKKLNPANILAVTFTIDAAEELKERIRKIIITSYKFLMGEINETELTDSSLKQYLESIPKNESLLRLKEAMLLFDEASIYTIHKFCKRVLSENPIDTNATFEQNFSSDDKDFLIDTLYHLYRQWLYKEDFIIISYFLKKYTDQKLINLINSYFFSINSIIIPPKDVIIDEIKDLHTEVIDSFYQLKNNYNKPAKYKDEFFAQENTLINDFGNFKVSNKIMEAYPDFTEKYQLLCSKIEQHIENNIFNSLEELEKQLNIQKMKKNLLTFTDIIRNVYLAIKKHTLNPKKYGELQALLIDEFQDTDFLQVFIFEKIFEDKTAFFIGDPKQSIYRFRGADLNAYFYATDKVEKKNRFRLTTCYRSTKNLIDNFNKIFSQNNFFQDSKISYEKINVPSLQKLHIVTGDKTKDLCIYLKDVTNKSGILDDVISEINYLLKNAQIKEIVTGCETVRKITPSDIAIIVPSNMDAEDIRAHFSKYGIKTVLNSTKSVFETDEAKELYLLFDALENYSNNVKVQTALLTKIFNKKINELSEETISHYKEKFSKYSKLLTKKGIIPLFLHLFKEEKTKINILKETGGERIFTNYMHILELLQNASRYENLTIENIKKWLSARMTGSVKESEDYELRLESDQNAVKITTIHKSKGLEYPVVFLLFFNYSYSEKYEDFFFTEFDATKGQHVITSKSLASTFASLEEDIAEKARLFYVSLTRAKGKCYLFDYKTKGYKYLDTFLYGAAIGEKLNFETKISSLTNLLQDTAIIKVIQDESKEIAFHTIYQESLDLKFNEFQGEIKRDYQLSSYSAITHGKTDELTDFFDDEYLEEVLFNELDIKSKTELPPGAKTGNMIHQILETIPYDISDKELKYVIEEFIRNYGFDNNAYNYTFNMIKSLLNKSIIIDRKQFYLKDLSSINKINEFEFYIPIKNLNDFLSSVHNLFLSKGEKDFAEQIKTLINGKFDFKHYLRGFIDLVFEYNGKFYIIDWKTNYLGDNLSDYSLENIKDEIAKNHYYLQILLYQLALYKYLKQLNNKNFKLGEVFYIFTRGFDPSKNLGIFRYRFSEEELDAIE
ncbi:UvrD-helicase domain-containing protein [Deferribacter abyssi]|uniref:UvrD-helicase domain-containing protein n=1 Tax=Deferribacter abyssi TaxID=213806 RepID=UPI003C171188